MIRKQHCKLTGTYHELLTMEARLTLDEQASAEREADGLSLASAARTFYRRRTGGSIELGGEDGLTDLVGWLWTSGHAGHCP